MDYNTFLPIDFINRMEQDLGPAFHAFLRSYDENKICALRFNALKAREDAIEKLNGIIINKVEWSPNGYYYDENTRPGVHPYHAAGVFYIQDASAQLPVEMLSPKPGDFVLDLCAAPGGKSTQLAGKLQGQGILVANEPMKNRAKILSENIERLGVKNAVVVSEFPDRLAEKFENYFDKILVDAPCSGEGMFRKNHDACAEWSLENVTMCAQRQAQILDEAYRMLLPGGRLCYSTCTFSRAEDEECVEAFLSRHEDMFLVEERRLWPHEIKGEGHYAALFEKRDDINCRDDLKIVRSSFIYEKINNSLLKDYFVFEKEALKFRFDNLVLKNDQLYSLPDECPDYSGLHVLRAGVHLGTLKKNRFEPSHALALSLKMEEVMSSINFSADSNEIADYLRGQTLSTENKDGWALICVDGYSIGWGKVISSINFSLLLK